MILSFIFFPREMVFRCRCEIRIVVLEWIGKEVGLIRARRFFFFLGGKSAFARCDVSMLTDPRGEGRCGLQVRCEKWVGRGGR